MKAKALKKGDLIGVFSPSSWVEAEKVDTARRALEQQGYRVFIHPQTLRRAHQFAGSEAERTAALHDLLRDRNVKAIFAAGGGNGALHWLDDIDYALVKKHPKILLGFSDVTALLNAFQARTGLVTFHGPVLTWIPAQPSAMNDFNMNILSGKAPSYPLADARVLRGGLAEGKLVGGNLSLFHLLPGTAQAPKAKGAILFLEDVGEELSHIDRMFVHLKRTGVLGQISGLVCGAFSNSKDTGRKPFGMKLDDIVLKHIGDRKIPIVMDAPFGHTTTLYTMPVGGKARLSARGRTVRLKLTEPAVKI